MRVIAALVLLLGISSLQPGILTELCGTENRTSKKTRQLIRTYRNSAVGFEATIPSPYSIPAPEYGSASHGFEFFVGSNRSTKISAMALFGPEIAYGVFAQSNADVRSYMLESLRSECEAFQLQVDRDDLLAPLKAVRLEGTCPADSKQTARRLHVVYAMRKGSDGYLGTLYTVELECRVEDLKVASPVFEQLLKSFHLIPEE